MTWDRGRFFTSKKGSKTEMGQGTVLRPTRPGTIESLIRFAGTSSTAYPQGTQSGPPVHLAVPENCCGLTLILAVFDRCGNSGFASERLAVPEKPFGLTLILRFFDRCGDCGSPFSATGSGDPQSYHRQREAGIPRARGRQHGTPRANVLGVFWWIKLLIDACFSIIMTSNMGRIGCPGANRLWDREPSPVP